MCVFILFSISSELLVALFNTSRATRVYSVVGWFVERDFFVWNMWACVRAIIQHFKSSTKFLSKNNTTSTTENRNNVLKKNWKWWEKSTYFPIKKKKRVHTFCACASLCNPFIFLNPFTFLLTRLCFIFWFCCTFLSSPLHFAAPNGRLWCVGLSHFRI